MKITMDGEYAYRCEPTKKVRILCVDRANDNPVVSLGEGGVILTHTEDGKGAWALGRFDLVPLEKPPFTLWAVFNKSGKCVTIYPEKDSAEKCAQFFGGSVVKMVEVQE